MAVSDPKGRNTACLKLSAAMTATILLFLPCAIGLSSVPSVSTLAADEASVRLRMENAGQSHLFNVDVWGSASDGDKLRFLHQVHQLDNSYPGGVEGYVQNSRKLLADSKEGLNPLEGWAPAVPEGAKLEFGSEGFLEHEALGLKELGALSFVLVAGGLGERLGFSGIKVALPWQMSTRETYLEL